MSTIILRWNPEISSYKMPQFKAAIREAAETQDYQMNWSIWEHEKAHANDRFYLLRVGNGPTGIVMSGTLTSEPYRSEDWSGKGRVTFYADLIPDFLIDTEKCPRLSIEDLEKAIPDFTWGSGHSGIVLDEEKALTLEWLWFEYLLKLPFTPRQKNLACNAIPLTDRTVETLYHVSPTMPLIAALAKQKSRCEICGYDYSEIFNLENSLVNISRYFPSEQKESSLKSRFHCVCFNCENVYKELLSDAGGKTLLPFEALLHCKRKLPKSAPYSEPEPRIC